ncbi:MAG TPA: AIR synthase related protein, partial [Chloroflexota bacterium]
MLVLKGTRVDADLRVEIRARRAAVPAVARDLERLGVGLLEQSRLFCLEGPACDLESHHMTPLFNSLVETLVFEHSGEYSFARDADEQNTSPSLDIFCRSGVTDEEGHTASLALQYAGLPDLACRAGRRFRFSDVVPPAIRPAVERALGNPLIHTFRWSDDPGVTPDQSADAGDYDPVATIALRGASDTALLEISRLHHLALDLSEMRAIDRHFTALERDPTDVELQSIALAWSEHCSHKTFRATIDFEYEGKREVIPGLLQSCIVAPSASLNRKWVRSAFVDNAGVIAFDRQWDLAAKVETHNHPSALEPYGGAHTGIGGVIRDVLAVSAEPIANTDVLCFGPSDLPDTLVPPGTFHPE